jgi:hypothetical protein
MSLRQAALSSTRGNKITNCESAALCKNEVDVMKRFKLGELRSGSSMVADGRQRKSWTRTAQSR